MLIIFKQIYQHQIETGDNDIPYYLHSSSNCTVFSHYAAFLSNYNQIHFLELHRLYAFKLSITYHFANSMDHAQKHRKRSSS